MNTMNVSEAKTHFSRVVDEVIAGGTVYISKRNLPVAQITPLSVASATKRHRTRVGWAKQTGVEILDDLTGSVMPPRLPASRKGAALNFPCTGNPG